jgi:hypothetical protein
MGQFKPMVKMMTTEPSVELKLKKGGSAHKKMKGDTKTGHKDMPHKMDGGVMGALAGATPVIAGRTAAPIARVPARPSMASRRRAMAVGRPAMSRMPMKKGGKACYATGGAIPSEETYGSYKTTEVHQAKSDKSPAKTGGVKLGNAGGFKKGGMTMKHRYATGGKVVSETTYGNYDTTEVHQAKPDMSKGKTGDVKKGNAGGYKKGGMACATGGVALSNAGGYKKGGASKKAFASGGSVQDEGKATSMPQGNKKPSAPVAINMLSGSFKKGGNVSSKELQADFKKENATAMKEAKAKLLDKYSPYQKAGGGQVSDSEYQSVMQAEKAGKKTMIDKPVKATPPKAEKRYPSGLTDSDIDKVLSSKKFQEGASHFSDYKRGGKAKK